MENQQIIQRLQERVRREFKWDEEGEKRKIRIANFHVNEDPKNFRITVVGDDNSFIDFYSHSELNSWINTIKETDGPKPAPKQEASLPARQTNSNAVSVPDQEYSFRIGGNVLSEAKEIVLDNIKKLQGEKGSDYIPQAQAINKEVHTIIDLAKTEIELVKTMKF